VTESDDHVRDCVNIWYCPLLPVYRSNVHATLLIIFVHTFVML